MSTQETARTLYLEANNIKFAYRLIGTAPEGASTVPLLMLNHFRANIDLWDPLLINGLVAGGRQLLTYDYAGVGHSEGEPELTIKAMSKNLIAFLRTLLPTLKLETVDVLGFSLGGFVAQQLAIDAPDLVGRMVLAGTGPSGSIGPLVQKPMAEVQSAIMSESTGDGSAILDAFFPSFIAKDKAKAWIGRVIGGRKETAGKDGEPEFRFFLNGPGLKRLREAYLLWDADPVPYALLQTIQKDVLVTAGANDLIAPTQNSYALSRQLPRANFVVYPGAGHGHLFQFVEFYAKQVTSFLNGEWPAPALSGGEIRPQESI